MPLHHNTIEKYYQFGTTGKKYYYHDAYTKSKAHSMALAQARAIEANKHKKQ
jgi:hypothetical protein